MRVRGGVLAIFLWGCSGQPAGVAELALSVTPAAFSDTVTQLTVVIHATDAKGQVGTGEVTLVASVGTIAPESINLDGYGSGRAIWTCATGCEAGGTVEAAWRSTGASTSTPPVRASKNAAYEAGTAGGGGGGGTTGPFTTRIDTGSTWRVTAAPPSTAWTTLGFDDASWPQAVVVVPAGGSPGQVGDSIWDLGPTVSSGSQQVWVRRTFSIPGAAIDSALLDIACNDDMQVWVNGTSVVTDADGVTTVRLGVNIASALVVGQNVIAASCRDVVLPDHSIWGRLVVKSR